MYQVVIDAQQQKSSVGWLYKNKKVTGSNPGGHRAGFSDRRCKTPSDLQVEIRVLILGDKYWVSEAVSSTVDQN